MKSLFILALALVSTNASAALREPGRYTGRCDGVTVQQQMKDGKPVGEPYDVPYYYLLDMTVVADGAGVIETTKQKLFSEGVSEGFEFEVKNKVEQIGEKLIRTTSLDEGSKSVCEYEIDLGGTRVLAGCLDRNGKREPVRGQNMSFVSAENVEYSIELDPRGFGKPAKNDFTGTAVAYSTMWCTNSPAK